MKIDTLTPQIRPYSPSAGSGGATAAARPADVVSLSSPPPDDEGHDSAQMMKMAVTGITGVALTIPCTYAGVIGGGVVGAALGGALGPMAAAAHGGGILASLGAVWTGAGTVGRVGAFIGGLTAIAGSFAVGAKLGNKVGHMAGIPQDNTPPKPIHWKNAATVVAGTTLMTTGVLSGLVGGVALAGGTAAAATVVNGLFQSGFSPAALAGVGHNALLYGLGGGALAGTVGTMGAVALTKGLARDVIDPATALPWREGLKKAGKAIKEQFSKLQGKDFSELFKQITPEMRKDAGIGAVAGGVVGAGIGGLVAYNAVQKVPIQTDTERFQLPSMRSEELGKIPAGYTSWGPIPPVFGNPPSTEPVMRENPILDAAGKPTMYETSKTFSGHGTPVVSWRDNTIAVKSMSGFSPVSIPITHQQFDHTEHYTEQVPYTTYTTETQYGQDCTSQYNADGSTSQDCRPTSTTVQVPHTEYRSEDRTRDVYRTVVDGYNVSFSPNIHDRVVGHYQTPNVSFEHGVPVVADIAIGLGIGVVAGAVAGGIVGAIRDKYAHPDAPTPPHPHPDPDPAPDPTPHPSPPSPPPVPPTPPADYGGYARHSHNAERHAHSGGDRWHTHQSPDDPVDANPINTTWICFKPKEVPSGYDKAEGIARPNGSLCFHEKGRKS